MKIFNTMSRQKEELIPTQPGKIRIYVCGPTVYNFIHVGNARPLCVFDTLRRHLAAGGYGVTYVSNITDIDDKLIGAANEQGVAVKDIAQKFEKEYLRDADGLNVLRPSVMPRATEHMGEIIELIGDILDKGYGYVAKNGDVYFRALKFEGYGKLSHMALDELESGRKLSHSLEGGLKENGPDFAVWKAAKPGEPAWNSPWGMGRPGWHIECSAMAKKHLGEPFDIHAGGQDLIFPHHENEIAQSECVSGKPFARYWMHNGFLNIDSEKMSKSLGNFRTVREVAGEMGYEAIRYFMLSAHYRSPLNFTRQILEQCKTSLERLYTCRDNLAFTLQSAGAAGSNLLRQSAEEARQAFNQRMNDDLNTADALAALFDFAREVNTQMPNAAKPALQKAADVFDGMCGVLGLLYNRRENSQTPPAVLQLLQRRGEARAAKNWQQADEIRAQLAALGYTVEDTPQGPKLGTCIHK